MLTYVQYYAVCAIFIDSMLTYCIFVMWCLYFHIHIAPQLPRKKFKKMSSEDASPIKVAIDFGFEDLMTDKVYVHQGR